jgi:hypothetical protein
MQVNNCYVLLPQIWASYIDTPRNLLVYTRRYFLPTPTVTINVAGMLIYNDIYEMENPVSSTFHASFSICMPFVSPKVMVAVGLSFA